MLPRAPSRGSEWPRRDGGGSRMWCATRASLAGRSARAAARGAPSVLLFGRSARRRVWKAPPRACAGGRRRAAGCFAVGPVERHASRVPCAPRPCLGLPPRAASSALDKERTRKAGGRARSRSECAIARPAGYLLPPVGPRRGTGRPQNALRAPEGPLQACLTRRELATTQAKRGSGQRQPPRHHRTGWGGSHKEGVCGGWHGTRVRRAWMRRAALPAPNKAPAGPAAGGACPLPVTPAVGPQWYPMAADISRMSLR